MPLVSYLKEAGHGVPPRCHDPADIVGFNRLMAAKASGREYLAMSALIKTIPSVFFAFIVFQLATANEVTAKTEWPDFQTGLTPMDSKSSTKAELPSDTKISPPDASLPDYKAKYSGLWEGWMCRKQACDTKLAIETLTSDGAEGALAIADDSSGKWIWEVTFKFDEGELITHLPNGDKVALGIRSDGNLNIKKTKKDGNWIVGILNRSN